ncbi:hypothetical protein FH608_046225 [Nonomuraea phyllanthi]|uniref:Uncharacterized protein n=1 Tax=Nonomuraea phyllanthi TaxID=2219224 RepID=A0A5C4V6A5_9ACTN|nr:hypothetical protein [Nonomuraea phyllanthi]KAB8186892.1 hypothetical protein FH608_046225 [Nonomuraea phyllanthi]
MAALTAAHLHEVAEWMRRWQPTRRVAADPARSRILSEGQDRVIVYEEAAVRRLVLTSRARS